jgi:hypothetical protein
MNPIGEWGWWFEQAPRRRGQGVRPCPYSLSAVIAIADLVEVGGVSFAVLGCSEEAPPRLEGLEQTSPHRLLRGTGHPTHYYQVKELSGSSTLLEAAKRAVPTAQMDERQDHDQRVSTNRSLERVHPHSLLARPRHSVCLVLFFPCEKPKQLTLQN